MDIVLYGIIGMLAGALVSWIVLNNSYRKKLAHENDKKLEFEKESLVLKEKLSMSETGRQGIEKENTQLTDQFHQLSEKLAREEMINNNLKEKLENQKEELENLQKKFTTEFENIANRILRQNSSDFTQVNQKNISEILKPLKEKISGFEQKVEETYEKGLRDRTHLRAELQNLLNLNKQISEEANNLTRALKSDTKKMGNWGELILDRILEQSGLIKGEEYDTQYTDRNEDGTMIRPDVVIFLPEKKHIIIDSKVSLVAYDAYVNTEDEATRLKLLKAHLESIKEHVKGLSGKKYQQASSLDVPDFVLMFMPLESAFSLAIQNDPNLFNFAWERKIVIVSPTTLLATLKTIESIWKHEKQTRNAIEIAKAGGSLYDKFYNFLADLEKLGGQIDSLQNTYKEARKKISDGRGNLIMQVERLKKLGVKTDKSLTDKFHDHDLIDETNN